MLEGSFSRLFATGQFKEIFLEDIGLIFKLSKNITLFLVLSHLYGCGYIAYLITERLVLIKKGQGLSRHPSSNLLQTIPLSTIASSFINIKYSKIISKETVLNKLPVFVKPRQNVIEPQVLCQSSRRQLPRDNECLQTVTIQR